MIILEMWCFLPTRFAVHKCALWKVPSTRLTCFLPNRFAVHTHVCVIIRSEPPSDDTFLRTYDWIIWRLGYHRTFYSLIHLYFLLQKMYSTREQIILDIARTNDDRLTSVIKLWFLWMWNLNCYKLKEKEERSFRNVRYRWILGFKSTDMMK